MSVSVALCTHNGAGYIAAQVQSILDQSVPVSQIVLSDDASSDDTVAIALATIAAHARAADVDVLVFTNQPALGVAKNFEHAMSACTGELIALSDQDDVWHAERIAIAVERFRAEPELTFLHGDARLVDGSGEPLGSTLFQTLRVSRAERDNLRSGRAFTAFLRRNLATGATSMFRRELLESAVPFPAWWVHDEWLAVIASIIGRVDYVETPLIDYRQHGANLIGAHKPGLREKIDKLRLPRGTRTRELANRNAALQERVAQLRPAAPHEVSFALEAKARHLARRQALPAARLLRIVPVMRGVFSGRYARYGLLYDVARDLFQPGVD